MKRYVSILLTVLFLLTLFSFPVSANTSKTAYDTVYDGMMACDTVIDIASYNLTAESLEDLVESVLKNEPMLFHCADSYRYSISGGKIMGILPNYDITGNDLKNARDFVESKLKHILDCVPEGLDDYEKAVFLHDYICVNFAYDVNLNDGIVYDIYELFKQDVGVCMAYSLLYDELLSRLGIETRAIISPVEELNHMWNEIKLDGKWYQVDVTWDDPVADRFGKASHANFLESDNGMSLTHNKVYYSEYPCTDIKYDDIDWKYNDRPFGFANGDMYVLIDNVIWKMDFHTGESERMTTAGGRHWYATDGSYLGCCVDFCSYDNLLYYNTEDSIMRYDPESNTAETVYTADKSEGMIIGMYMDGNKVVYLASSTGKTADGVKYSFTIEDESDDSNDGSDNSNDESDNSNNDSDDSNDDSDNSNDESSNDDESSNGDESGSDEGNGDNSNSDSASLGDINKDGGISVADYILVKRSCLGTYKLTDEERLAADIDENNKVDAVDYVLIKRVVLGTYTIKPSNE